MNQTPPRDRLTPCPRAQAEPGPGWPTSPGWPLAGAGLDPEAIAWNALVNRRCDQATLILIFAALVWFGTALPGAPHPGEFVGLSSETGASAIGATLP